jgi:hypothetical protein
VIVLNLSDENFLEETEKFLESSLNKKYDVQQIISHAVLMKREAEFNELIFTAKYLRGLMRVAEKAPGIPEVENIEHIKSDISDNMNKVVEQIRSLMAGIERNKIDFFEENYLSLNQNSFINLNFLLDDLESVKKFLNHLKHSH